MFISIPSIININEKLSHENTTLKIIILFEKQNSSWHNVQSKSAYEFLRNRFDMSVVTHVFKCILKIEKQRFVLLNIMKMNLMQIIHTFFESNATD